MTKSRYDTIETLFSETEFSSETKKSDTEELHNRWQRWKRRFEVYEDLNHEKYIRFFQLQEDRKLVSQESKLTDTLRALKDFYKSGLQTSHPEIEATILELIDIELSKIEIRQFIKLSKIQLLGRQNLKEEMEKLKAKRMHSRVTIRENVFSEKIKDANAPDLLAFLKFQETKFHAGIHQERADYAAGAAKGVGTSTFAFSFVNTMRSIFEPLARPFIALGDFLNSIVNGIPLLSSIVTAIPIIFNAWKAWFRNKSTTKKVIYTIATIAAIAGIVLSAVFLGLGVVIVESRRLRRCCNTRWFFHGYYRSVNMVGN